MLGGQGAAHGSESGRASAGFLGRVVGRTDQLRGMQWLSLAAW